MKLTLPSGCFRQVGILVGLLLLLPIIIPIFIPFSKVEAMTLTTNSFITAGAVRTDAGKDEYYRNMVNNTWNFLYDGKAGINFSLKIDERLSAMIQVLAKNRVEDKNYNVKADWAILKYRIWDELTVQIGKQRIPVWLISNYYEVGYLYPWVRPPQSVYAISSETQEYTGLQLSYGKNIGPVFAKVGVARGHTYFEGIINIDDNPTYNATSNIQSDVSVTNAHLELTYDTLLVRFAWTLIDDSNGNTVTNTFFKTTVLSPSVIPAGTTAVTTVPIDSTSKYIYNSYGLKWESNFNSFIWSEYAESHLTVSNIDKLVVKGFYATYGQIFAENWTPLITYLQGATNSQLAPVSYITKHKAVALGLNYKIGEKTNVKLEYQRMKITGSDAAYTKGPFSKSMVNHDHPSIYSINVNTIF